MRSGSRGFPPLRRAPDRPTLERLVGRDVSGIDHDHDGGFRDVVEEMGERGRQHAAEASVAGRPSSSLNNLGADAASRVREATSVRRRDALPRDLRSGNGELGTYSVRTQRWLAASQWKPTPGVSAPCARHSVLASAEPWDGGWPPRLIRKTPHDHHHGRDEGDHHQGRDPVPSYPEPRHRGCRGC